MLSCKFATYFQNTLTYEQLWTAASEIYLLRSVDSQCLVDELSFHLMCQVDWWSSKTYLRDLSWILSIFLFIPLDKNIQVRVQYEN